MVRVLTERTPSNDDSSKFRLASIPRNVLRLRTPWRSTESAHNDSGDSISVKITHKVHRRVLRTTYVGKCHIPHGTPSVSYHSVSAMTVLRSRVGVSEGARLSC